MGRSPCCDKIGLKKGPWTPEEDQKLLAYIEEHGHGSWRALPTKAGLQRCGKSCRLRWTNYLRPDIKRGKFSLQEEQTIIQLHALLGNRWSAIATHLAKRTDNEIKNYWNTHLKKRLAKMGIDPVTHKPKNDALLSNLVDGAGQSKSAANLSHMAQWESARLEAEARLVRQSNLRTTLSSQTQQQSAAEFATTSSQIQKPAAGPALCLDVLKAWSGGGGGAWTNTSETTAAAAAAAAAAAGGELESPTSTLSSAAGNGNSIPPPLNTIQTSGSFVERFTDLLLSNSSGGDRQLSEDGGESDNSGVDGGGGGDYYEDNKNYWNSILNLVNSSPSDDSPIF